MKPSTVLPRRLKRNFAVRPGTSMSAAQLQVPGSSAAGSTDRFYQKVFDSSTRRLVPHPRTTRAGVVKLSGYARGRRERPYEDLPERMARPPPQGSPHGREPRSAERSDLRPAGAQRRGQDDAALHPRDAAPA